MHRFLIKHWHVTWIQRNMDRPEFVDRMGGDDWNATVENVIDHMRSHKRRKFFCYVGSKPVWLGLRRHADAKKFYIATEGDAYPPSNFLALPEGPLQAANP